MVLRTHNATGVLSPRRLSLLGCAAMLVRTRAVVALAQPKGSPNPVEEQQMFRRFCLHLHEKLDQIVLRSKEPPPKASAPASAPSTAAPATASGKRSPDVADPTSSYIPQRWLLMACYEAAHSEERISPPRREGVTIDLFARLTGDERVIQPSADGSLALYDEAAAIYRVRGAETSLEEPAGPGEPRQPTCFAQVVQASLASLRVCPVPPVPPALRDLCIESPARTCSPRVKSSRYAQHGQRRTWQRVRLFLRNWRSG